MIQNRILEKNWRRGLSFSPGLNFEKIDLFRPMLKAVLKEYSFQHKFKCMAEIKSFDVN